MNKEIAKEKYEKYKYKYNNLKNKLLEPKEKYFTTAQGYTIYYHEIYPESLTPDDITHDPSSPNKDKILVINDVTSFDTFTKIFGDANFNGQFMFIKWEKVANNFCGFYLNQDDKIFKLISYYSYNYKNKHLFTSWWSNEYFSSKVIIFHK